jgi:hypothetical protein
MEFQLSQAKRDKAKIKLGLQGPSGAGKTYSALLLAKGLCGDWSKVAVIDSEHQSANLYSHLGNYNVLPLLPPYSPERYSIAIQTCENAGMQVIIIDSISHEWEGQGGILEIHSNMLGNSFTNWSRLTPRHNDFINNILQSKCHIIATMRAKQDYVLSEKNGKQVPEKVGLKGITREGTDYELTLVLEVDIKHQAKSSKDRTGLFDKMPEFTITEKTGERILRWCSQSTSMEDVKGKVQGATDLQELTMIYNTYPEYHAALLPDFQDKKAKLKNNLITTIQDNGNTTNNV